MAPNPLEHQRDAESEYLFRPRKLRVPRLGMLVMAVAAILAPLGVVGVGSSSADQIPVAPRLVTIAAPAAPVAGSDDIYSVSTVFSTPFALPSVSDGVSTDHFHYTVEELNSAGCVIAPDGTGFHYLSAGSCALTVTAVPTVDSDGDTDGLSQWGASTDGCPEFHDTVGNSILGGARSVDCESVASLQINVNPAPQGINLAPQSVSLHTSIPLVATGYLGTGAITYQLVGGTAAGCAISSGNALTSSGAGTCVVVASIASSIDYLAAISSNTTFTFNAIVVAIAATHARRHIHRHVVVPPPTMTMSVVPFAEGSVILDPVLNGQINAIASTVKSKLYHVVQLTGYTDNVFTPAFNLALNQSRANAVKTQLEADIAALHVSGVNVSIVTNPTGNIFVPDSNVTTQGRAFNRRVVATLKAN